MNRDLAFLATALGIWGLGESMSIYFQSLYLEQLGADPLRIGFILGSAMTIMILVHIPAGYLADRIGRRPLMRASWILGTTATIIMGLAQSIEVFVLGMFLYNVTIFVSAPMNSYITAARGRFSAGRALTLISAFYSVGAAIGPLLGGAIADRFHDLRITYQIAACLFFISTLVIFWIRAQPREAPHPTENFRGILTQATFWNFMGVVFITTFATYLAQPLSNNFLAEVHNLSFSQIGRLGSLTAVGVVVLNLILGHLKAQRGFLLAQICVGAFTVLVSRGTSLPWFAVGYFLLGGFRTIRSLATAQTRDLVGQSRMGLAYGVVETVCALALIGAPPLAGILYKYNPTWMYTVSFGLILASVASSLLRNQAIRMKLQKETQ